MAEEFVLPDFLSGNDADTIHQKMLDMLPDDIDKTEGGFVWDFTRPTAMIAAELLEFFVPEILKLMFPQWSTGQYLDYLAAMAQTKRKEASCATALINIEGEAGTTIPAGTILATEAAGGKSSIEFATLESCTLDSQGSGSVTAKAVLPGKESNVNPGTIVLMSEPVNGVTAITNKTKATGGTEEESDDELRERVLKANADLDVSYVGNNADYKRWAEEVDGIGTAIIVPEWNGPETVKIVCLDANGEAANSTLLANVHNHIMSPDEPMERLAPPNVKLTVSAPDLVNVTYVFSVEIASGYDFDAVVAAFKKNVESYYNAARDDGTLKYNQVHAILTNTDGVVDFSGLLVNGQTKNIDIGLDEYPYTAGINATKEGS